MWSNLYFYYEIRGNTTYSRCLSTETVIKVLEGTRVLKKSDKQTFRNDDSYPWMHVVAVDSNNGNFGKEEHFNDETVNLIAVIGSKQSSKNEEFYIKFLSGIAELLNWELILESDDDGNEDIVLRAISYQ